MREISINEINEDINRCLLCKKPRCRTNCPIDTPIPQIIELYKNRNIEEAGEILFNNNPLSAVCGIICPHEKQCAGNCIKGIKQEPVKFYELETYISSEYLKSSRFKQEVTTKDKIAIIGSGPAGITMAFMLAKEGYKVTIFEKNSQIGGVLRYGIPPFRLPRQVLNREIDNLKELGVKFETNVVVGKSVTINQLKEDGFDAIFICSGAGLPKMLNIKGENLNGVYSANEFLTRVNLMNANDENSPTPLRVGTKAAIIGGGNVAMDAARTAVRVGFKEVYIVYRRTEAELPARLEEIRHAKEEGVIFKLLHSPHEIIGENGYVKTLQLEVMELGEPDESGRRRPIPTGEIVDMDVDTVIVALGTGPNPIIQSSANDEGLDLNTDKRGYIIIDKETGKTSIDGVFAGGDVAPNGESNAINAMGAGKRAAKAINEYLNECK